MKIAIRKEPDGSLYMDKEIYSRTQEVQDENGKLHQFEEIKRGFRNIHFVSYCFGSVVQSAINQELRQYLQTTILDPKSIKILESQICVLQAAPIANETKTGQTTVNFVSLDDEATKERPIQAKAIAEYRDLKEKNIIGGVVKSSNDNPTVYVVKFTSVEDEEHFSEFYLHSLDKWPKGPYESKYEENVGGILPVCTSVCLRRAMKNAVSNLGANEYTPLKVGDLIKPCDKYMDWAKYHPQNIPKNLLDIYNNHFNYTTNNLIEVLEKDDNKDLINLYKFLIERCNETREKVVEDENYVMKVNRDYNDILSRAKYAYEKVSILNLDKKGVYTTAKPILNSKLLCYTGITGIYSPFTGEPNVNVAVPDIYIPFTTLHEMAHQRGYGSEDEANFLAYIAN